VPPMSIKSYAASRGSDPQAIRRAVSRGIVKLVDGKVDPEQADASWASVRRASRLGQYQHDEVGERAARAKIAVTLGRLRLIKQRLDIARERYVDRSEAIAVGEFEAVYTLDSLRAAAGAHSAKLATQMGIPDETARRILDRFVGLMLVEIGDLPGQARRDAERA
jgi:hypothetical protein